MVLVLPFAVHSYAASYFNANQTLFLALLTGAVVLWVFRLVADFVPGISLILLASLLDLVPQPIAFSGFYSQIFFLVMGVFILAALLNDSGLIARLEQWLLGSKPSFFNSMLMLLVAGLVLTLIVPSPLGRATMIKPLVDRFLEKNSASKNTLASVVSVHGSTLFSTVFLTGNPLNFVLLALLNEQTQGRFDWLGWLLASAVVGMVLLVALMSYLYWSVKKLNIEPVTVLEKKEKTPLTLKEYSVIGLYGLLIVGVFTQGVHQIELAWVVLFLALSVFYFQGVSLSALKQSVDWPTLLFIASVVAWQGMLDHLELTQWIQSKVVLFEPIFEQSFYIGISYLMLMIIVVRLIIPGAPAFILFGATLLPLATQLGVSPWLMLFILLTLSEAFIFPYQHGVYSMAISQLDGGQLSYHSSWLFRSNIFFLAVKIIAIYLSIPWWQALYLL